MDNSRKSVQKYTSPFVNRSQLDFPTCNFFCHPGCSAHLPAPSHMARFGEEGPLTLHCDRPGGGVWGGWGGEPTTGLYTLDGASWFAGFSFPYPL